MPIVLAMGVGPLLFSTAVFHCCFHLFPWSTGALNSTLATPPHLTPPHHTARLSHYTPPMRFQSAFSIFVFNMRFQSAIRAPSKFFSHRADCPFDFLSPKANLHCKFLNPKADWLIKFFSSHPTTHRPNTPQHSPLSIHSSHAISTWVFNLRLHSAFSIFVFNLR